MEDQSIANREEKWIEGMTEQTWADDIVARLRENPHLLDDDPVAVIANYMPDDSLSSISNEDRAAFGTFLSSLDVPTVEAGKLGGPSQGGCTACCIATVAAIAGVGIGALIASGGLVAAVAPEVAAAVAAATGVTAEAAAETLAAAEIAAARVTGGLVMQTSVFIGTLITGLCISLGACPKT